MAGGDEYLDVEALAQYLMMSPNTIRQYVSKGRIPYIKVPGSHLVRFLRSQVDTWMMEGLRAADRIAEGRGRYSGGKHRRAETVKEQGR